ncbi:MAG: biotin--[acetyl-CoA-carboxylase] ligase [candidate division Zixibacteria bacterium]|nr:biotin--[acetyl-CoA-carboxylase] ligase [candidate division Zixibacteria bacterium]
MNQGELVKLADNILVLIRKKPKQVFEISTVARKLKSEIFDIHKAAKVLKTWGYGIKLSKSEITFNHTADTLSATEINFYLKTKIIGQNLVSFHSVKSTNDIASQVAGDYPDESVVITSEKQTLGRGRLGRSWHSPEKVGAYISIIITPKISLEKAPGLSVMTALAAAKTFESYCPGKVQIKWPNDILIGNRKVAGVLTELYTKNNKINYVVVGIGINVNQKPRDFPQNLRKFATSLRQVVGKKINRAELTAEFLNNFEKEYKKYQKNQLAGSLKRLRAYSSLLGQTITLKAGDKLLTGEAIDIDKTGALIVKVDGKKVTVSGGEVTVLKRP